MGKRGIYLVCAFALLFGMLQGIPVCQAIAEQTGNGATGVYVKGPLMGDADDQEDERRANEPYTPAATSVSTNVSGTTPASDALPRTGDGIIGVVLVVFGTLLTASVIVVAFAIRHRRRIGRNDV